MPDREPPFGPGNGQLEPITDERSYLLLSLRPPYYYQMKAGTKRYEYRRRFVAHPCIAFLYLSMKSGDPLSGTIPAKVEFGQPIIDRPAKIGELAERQKPGSNSSILAYLAGRERGYAIPIMDLMTIEPIPLAELRQSFPSF